MLWYGSYFYYFDSLKGLYILNSNNKDVKKV